MSHGLTGNASTSTSQPTFHAYNIFYFWNQVIGVLRKQELVGKNNF